MLSWLSFGHAEEIAGVSMQPVPTVQGGTWAFGTFLGGILGVAGSLGEFPTLSAAEVLEILFLQQNKLVT